MAIWIAGVAMLGLICLMILPAPGIWGVLIGGICVLAIALSAMAYLLDRMSSRLLSWHRQQRVQRAAKRRRAVHAGSGMAKKA